MASAVANGTIADPAAEAVTKWAAIAGRWKYGKTSARYEGPEPQSARAPVGVLLAGPRLRNGVISTEVKLHRTERTAAGVAVGFQSLNAPYLSVQIGGFENAYAIAEYRPDFGWVRLTGAGSVGNLDPNQPLHLRVEVAGQTVRMTVDDVHVLSHVLPRPIEGTGFGLYAYDDAPVEFKQTTVVGLPPKVFVMMPFAEPFDTLYRDVIKDVAQNSGFEVVRVDEVTGPGMILDDIQQQIEEAHAVVAEISTHNPNVFYELGYAHALHKPAVLLVRRQDGEKMPFDIRGYRAIFYDDNIGGKKTVETNLKQHLDAIKRERVG